MTVQVVHKDTACCYKKETYIIIIRITLHCKSFTERNSIPSRERLLEGVRSGQSIVTQLEPLLIKLLLQSILMLM